MHKVEEIPLVQINNTKRYSGDKKCTAFSGHLEAVFGSQKHPQTNFANTILNFIESHMPQINSEISPMS